MKTLIVLFLLSQSSISRAALQLGSPSSEIKVKDVTLSQTMDNSVAHQSLKRVAQGFRQKHVFVITADVYVAQFFTNGAVVKTSAEAFRQSLMKALPVGVTMTFLRKIDNEKIMESYRDSFAKNNLNTNVSPYSDFMLGVKKFGEVINGQTVYFWFDQAKGKRSLKIQTNDQDVFLAENLTEEQQGNFLKMWLGNPGDDGGLKSLQEQLLK